MKRFQFILILVLSVSGHSCSQYNKIRVSHDPYREVSTMKMKQKYRVWSDDFIQSLLDVSDYRVRTNYYHERSAGGNRITLVDFILTTEIRPDELEQEVYLSADGEIINLEPDTNRTRVYSLSSSTVETVMVERSSEGTTAEKNEEGEATGKEVTTSISSTTENSAHQMMALRCRLYPPDFPLILDSEELNYRLYLGQEGLDIPVRGKKLRVFKRYIQSLQ